MKPDGVFLANGPGDPEPCEYAVRATREFIDRGLPTFGICLGHQIMALAMGARTYKMKFGHHGANHPVKDLDSGRVSITSQNHGFAVDPKSLPASMRPTHVSLFDGTLQGLAHTTKPAFCFQGHPEASPGPHDIGYLFDRFTAMMEKSQRGGRMPKRTDLEAVLIIGAGPIVIGQACEFDYSGAQACKALREEGYRVILVNSNPATIMTDPEMADVTYIEPITWSMVEKIIAKERPLCKGGFAVLPTMGGQTALNCALDLAKHGVLGKYGVEMIGANEHAIEKAEDRLKFKDAMTGIGLASARSGIAHTLDEALVVQRRIAGLNGGQWLSDGDPAELHARRHRRRHRLQPGRVRRNLQARPSTSRRPTSCSSKRA